MPVPTEPGPHYWRSGPDAPWQIVEVSKGARGLEFEIFERYRGEPGAWCWYDVDMEWGEWGERIPDNPTLKAMREITADEWTEEGGGGGTYCVFCGAEQKSELIREYPHPLHDGTAREFRRWIDHAPDCPWLLAQEKTDANAD